MAVMAGFLRTLSAVACVLWLAGWAADAAAWSAPVQQAQERLDALGLDPGPIDGVMGTRTRDALRTFQQKHDLPATGELDWQTRMALAATVRTVKDAVPFPAPRAAPVPKVSAAPLPPPGQEPPTEAEAGAKVADAKVADAKVADTGATIAGGDATTAEPERTGTRTGFERLIGNVAEAAPTNAAPTGAERADDTPLLERLIPTIALGTAAIAVWAGLLVWWLRQRARRPVPGHGDD